MTKTKIEKMRSDAENLERLKEIAKEGEIIIIHRLRPIEKKVLSKFGDVSSSKLAEQVKVNRSYIYALVKRFETLLSMEACSQCRYKKHCEVL